jgi:6-phosphofructokinase 1
MQTKSSDKKRLGILVGGGPAPGINGVIAAATAEALHRGLEVVGICEGFKWLAKGDASHTRRLALEDVEPYRDRGGSILRTARENPTKDPAKMANALRVIRDLGLDYLVTIGGDDTAFSTYKVASELPDTLRVVHVPKTIDNDLPLPEGVPTFGFETARHVGIGTAAGAPLTIIPEEFAGGKPTLASICEIIETSIAKCRAAGRDHGVAVMAEGLIGLLADELKNHPWTRDNPLVELKYDDHNHLRQEGVPLGLILKQMLKQRAEKRDEKLTVVDARVGYELRCADPIPFDVEYTHQLGWAAVDWLLRPDAPRRPSLILRDAGKCITRPLDEMLDPDTGRMTVRPVTLNSSACPQQRQSE